MQKSRVVIAVCDSYDEEKVYQAVRSAVETFGGIGMFVSDDENILVKPNFLYASAAARSITTHPSVLRAVLRLLQEAGCGNVLYGDSPAAGTSAQAAEKLGLDPEDEFGARLAPMDEKAVLNYPAGRAAQKFVLSKEAAEADAIIGVCKMKTHMLMRMTGAVKNMYGLVNGMNKTKGHVSFPNAAEFAKMLIDIHQATPQRLHIMDAVVAMEGNGPSSGTPTPVGLILVSPDPVAIDAVSCRLVHLDPKLVETNLYGMLGGLGTFETDGIELLLAEPGETGGETGGACSQESDSTSTAESVSTSAAESVVRAAHPVTMEELVSRFGKPDFDVQRNRKAINILNFWSKITGNFGEKPRIDAEKCVKCGKCVAQCPVDGGAVHFFQTDPERKLPPVYNYKKCIRCFCCQEICPKHAIYVR